MQNRYHYIIRIHPVETAGWGRCNENMIQMGKLIRQLRRQQGLSQEKLGEHLISKSELSRIENGQKEPDIFLLNALMFRLGESLEYFEIVVTGTEYELLRLRNLIKKSLQEKSFPEAERQLKAYEELTEGKKQLHDDYITEVKNAIKAKQQKVQLSIPELPKTVISAIELLKEIRKAKGWSQEQFSGDICARETISCIENGRTPNQKILMKLLEKHSITWNNYYGFVEAEDVKTYRLVKEYQNLAETNPEKAGFILKEIKKRLDTSLPVNRQFLESANLLEQLGNGTLSLEDGKKKLEHCLRYTMPDYDGKLHRIPYGQEVVLLQRMIECMKQLDEKESAEVLQQNLSKKLGKKLKVS